jgi:hypothetical protein
MLPSINGTLRDFDLCILYHHGLAQLRPAVSAALVALEHAKKFRVRVSVMVNGHHDEAPAAVAWLSQVRRVRVLHNQARTEYSSGHIVRLREPTPSPRALPPAPRR